MDFHSPFFEHPHLVNPHNEQWISFTLGNETYAHTVTRVKEILHYPPDNDCILGTDHHNKELIMAVDFCDYCQPLSDPE